MKLGINTFFIMKFGFEAGLKFCQNLGVKAVEVAATAGEASAAVSVVPVFALPRVGEPGRSTISSMERSPRAASISAWSLSSRSGEFFGEIDSDMGWTL